MKECGGWQLYIQCYHQATATHSERDTVDVHVHIQVQYMADLYWKRWSQEYLSLMQERHKWGKVRRNLTLGDVVMVVDPTAPRGSWILGRVLEGTSDSKELVWAVKIKTAQRRERPGKTHNEDLSVARRHKVAVPMLQPGYRSAAHECMALGSLHSKKMSSHTTQLDSYTLMILILLTCLLMKII